ncbi:hypothetical protein [Planctomyces sp. SH-PL14]|uniref:hypothetical protein n=1 Tax=Planctomyces sp. SH-PL14 TaxID=1632864 RepID=UPI0012E7A141|nr:hypothetical protein [Planctomyces sp. SH-PL14]
MAKKRASRPVTYSEFVGVRCTPEQLASWNEAAAQDERDLAEWIRRSLDSFLAQKSRPSK